MDQPTPPPPAMSPLQGMGMPLPQLDPLLLAIGGTALAELPAGNGQEQRLFDELYLLHPVGCFLLGPDTAIRQANLAGAALVGLDRTRLQHESFRSFVAPRFLADFDALLARAMQKIRAAPLHCRMQLQRNRGDAGVPVTLSCSVEGTALYVTVEPAEGRLAVLERSEERFRRIVQGACHGIWEFDTAARTTFVNPRMAAMLGYPIEAMLGRPLADFTDAEGRVILERNLARQRQGGTGQRDFRFVHREGRAVWVNLAASPIHDGDGACVGVLALLSDVTGQVESTEEAWRQANFDTLTGLPNRNMFAERLRHEMKKARRDNTFLALLFIDLDQFKQINDRFGHQQGDVLLVQAGERIGAGMRTSDTLARIGGDEFVAILPGLARVEDAERVAQDIIASLNRPFDLAGQRGHVSGSVGIALYPSDAADAEELLRHADQAMYAAKNGGRNRYSYFTEDMQAAAQQRARLAEDLRRAAAQREFELYYQPIVNLRNGVVERAEGLLRWNHPLRGLLNPADFIAGAESSGVLLEIGDQVVRQAADQALAWQRELGRPFQISINLSPAQLRDETQGWLQYVESLALPPKSLVVDVPEELLVEPSAQLPERLRRLHAMGMQVALDDFGTGHSALAQLKEFAIDYLKIDRSFVAGLAGEPGNAGDVALCEGIIVLAHKLGLEVVAEGVETPAQLALLKAAGCDYAQGYVFARAVPAAELPALARSVLLSDEQGRSAQR